MIKVCLMFPYFSTENESVILISRALYACYKGGGYKRSKVLTSILTQNDTGILYLKSQSPQEIRYLMSTLKPSHKNQINQNLLSSIKRPASSSRSLYAWPELAWAWSSRAASVPAPIQPRGLLLHCPLTSLSSCSWPSSAPDTSPSQRGSANPPRCFVHEVAPPRVQAHQRYCTCTQKHPSRSLVLPRLA